MAALIAVMSEIASFNGSYKRVKHEGLDAFLSLQVSLNSCLIITVSSVCHLATSD